MATRIFWAIVAGFLLGVFLRSFASVGLTASAFFVLLALSALLLAGIERAKLRLLVVVAVGLVACACGIMRMDAATVHGDPTLTELVGKSVRLEGIVVGEPDARETSTL